MDHRGTTITPRRVSNNSFLSSDGPTGSGLFPAPPGALQRVRPLGRSPGPSRAASIRINSPTRSPSRPSIAADLENRSHSLLSSPSKRTIVPQRKRPIIDRFIPTHSSAGAPVNMDIHRQNSSSVSAGSAALHSLDTNAPMRVFEFRTQPPKPSAAPDLRSKYAPQDKANTIANKAAKQICLPSLPEKTLDAPGMADDWYQQPLAWSNYNQLAILLSGQVWIWDSNTGNASQLTNYNQGGPQACSVQWSTDGYLGVGTFHGDVQIWDVERSIKLRSMRGRSTRIGSLCWNSHILTSGGRDGQIWNHDVRAREHDVAQLFGHRSEVCGLAWRSESPQLASGGNDNLICVWDSRVSAVPRLQKNAHNAAVKALAWCPWQRSTLATAGGLLDKQIHLWNSNTGARLATANANAPVSSLIWSSSSRELISCGGAPRNQIKTWSWPNLDQSASVDAHEGRILSSVMSPDGSVMATASSDEQLKFWRITEQPRRRRAASGMLDPTRLSLR